MQQERNFMKNCHNECDRCPVQGNTDMNTMPLIGEHAPEFCASTTNGKIKFPDDFAGQWIVLFSHPSDFTPVCTTEFIAFQQDMDKFLALNTQLIGLSIGGLASHLAWIDSIAKMPGGIHITFPLIDDMNMNIAKQYGMIHPKSSDTNAVRAVFIIDPAGIIRTILYYPPTLGRNISEIHRIITGLKTADEFGVAIPANWMPGEQVLKPAPKTSATLKKHSGNMPWFMTYKRLDKDAVYRKITKQKHNKK